MKSKEVKLKDTSDCYELTHERFTEARVRYMEFLETKVAEGELHLLTAVDEFKKATHFELKQARQYLKLMSATNSPFKAL